MFENLRERLTEPNNGNDAAQFAAGYRHARSESRLIWPEGARIQYNEGGVTKTAALNWMDAPPLAEKIVSGEITDVTLDSRSRGQVAGSIVSCLKSAFREGKMTPKDESKRNFATNAAAGIYIADLEGVGLVQRMIKSALQKPHTHAVPLTTLNELSEQYGLFQ